MGQTSKDRGKRLPDINDGGQQRARAAREDLSSRGSECREALLLELLKRVSRVRILPGAPRITPLTWGFLPREAL